MTTEPTLHLICNYFLVLQVDSATDSFTFTRARFCDKQELRMSECARDYIDFPKCYRHVHTYWGIN